MNIRLAEASDLPSILNIYNMGIEDRIATLEVDTKNMDYMKTWFDDHVDRYKVLVADQDGQIVGWASLNRYSHRCAYNGVADLSIYIARDHRGKGIGQALLHELDVVARDNQFYKIVLFTFPQNELGQRLYRKTGYRQVGVFEKQGVLEGHFIDVMAMEKIL